jgi:isoleucyl-tRNA synthetase
MAFEKVETQGVDFPALERRVLQFWNDEQIFEKLKAKNANGQPWSFLDGPITANNPMGVHHAWGRTYKDVYNRYFAMTGRQLRYQNGFDCQGLWVEVEVEKELGLKSKRDIENLVPGDRDASIAKFVQACKDRVDKFARIQTEQSIRLGMWMNWDVTDEDWKKSPDERKSYFTLSEENNYTIWAFLKRCFEKKRIYRGYDVMPWCGRCGVGLSEMEMKEGYKLVEHRAAFVKLPLKNRPNENLLVWTTTPWTLTSNVGAAVNPELTYLAVKLKGETYYVAKGVFKQNRMESSGDESDEPGGLTARKSKRDWLDGVPHLKTIEQLFKEKAGKDGFTIEGEVKGETLLGWEYEGPFDDLPAQNHDYGYPEEVASIVKQNGWCPCTTGSKAHRVVSGGKDVTEGEGTGIVHTAPGCGGIDFQWGKANGLPPVAPLDESGTFLDGFGPLAGKVAYDPATADVVFEELKKKDRLFATERYVHRYPHCWRCKTELLYRLVDEWFIDMGPRETEQGFRGEIMKVVEQVTFLPESLNGRARERQWLWQMGDWMISKKRFWGLALPIWVDDKDPTQFEVIGSKEELKKRAVEGWQDFEGNTPHRPYVDKIKIKNPKTGNLMSRVPDVGNPWLDAGIVAFSTMKWNTDRAYWKKWYPADFITESFPGQFRNWFYALLALSTEMGEGAPPFKTLLGFATVKDQFGHDMHKSAGNSIEFISAADVGGTTPDAKGNPTAFNAIGADVMRWLYCRQNPASNLNFGPMPANEVRAKFHIKLWNCYAFFCNYARLDGFDPTAPQVPVAERADIDRWILSDLQRLIKTAREAYERYDVMAFCLAAEEFVDAKLSNWYIRRNRDRFWSANEKLNDVEKTDKLAAYQTLHTVLCEVTKLIAPVVPFLTETMWENLRTDGQRSVHLAPFPMIDLSLLDEALSDEMNTALYLISLGLSARNVAKMKVRQPLALMSVYSENVTKHMATQHAIAKFYDQIVEELNIKQLRRFDSALLTATARLNKKTAAAKLGPNLKQAEAELAAMDATKLGGSIVLAGVILDAADYTVEFHAPDGYAGVADKGTQVMLDTRVTPELKAEGMARDVVRLVQDARKDAGLDVADKIALHLGASGELAAAIETHKATIAGETQAIDWLTTPPEGGHSAIVKVDGQSLVIGLKKIK